MDRRLVWNPGTSKNEIYAHNKEGEELGHLEYERVGAHMHWCWYQMNDIRMSPGCLQEVRDKQKELLNTRNKKEKEG